jgi:hypothetical protein
MRRRKSTSRNVLAQPQTEQQAARATWKATQGIVRPLRDALGRFAGSVRHPHHRHLPVGRAMNARADYAGITSRVTTQQHLDRAARRARGEG